MAVVNGQIANQTTFNNAFMSRTSANTQTVAKLALENTDLGDSGAYITNAQKAINKAFEGIGTTGEADAAINNYANQNYILNGDNRKVAVGKLDAQLKLTQDDLDTAETTIAGFDTRLDDLESNAMTIGGNKTFSANVIVQGDFEVQGTTTSINTATLEVEDQNILVNKNGTNLSAEDAGLDVERPLGNAGLRFDSTLPSKFKIGLLSALYEIIVSGVAQTISGVKDFVSGIKVDVVNESTLNSGVTVDGVLIKDGLVDGRDVSTDGTTLDGYTSDFTAIEGRLDDLETNNLTIAGVKTYSGNAIFQADTTLKNAKINENIFVGSLVNPQTGADVQLTPITAPVIKLTGVGLISIDRIDAPADAKIICLINQTGSSVTLKDNVGSPASARLRTGTAADVVFANNQIAVLVYDTVAALWYVSSISAAGGGGGGGKKTFTMKLNGVYGGLAAYNGVDGAWVAPVAMQITNIFIFQDTPGSSGTTELDLKVKPFAAGSFTSLFLTTPKVLFSAAAFSWAGVGDVVAGFTAPVLTTLPFAVAAKSALRMDLISSQLGDAAGVNLVIEYEDL